MVKHDQSMNGLYHFIHLPHDFQSQLQFQNQNNVESNQ